MTHSQPILLAYVACWAELKPEQIRGDLLTHVNYAFALIEDGRLVSFKDDKGLGLVRGLKTAYPHLKVLISIGGWAAEGFSDAALSAESRERFAESALSFMHEHGFDGLDLDWEYPGSSFAGIRSRPEDRDNFTALLSLLRQKLDAASDAEARTGNARYLLSIATGASAEHVAGVDIAQVAPILDFIGLMTYDLYNGWSTRTGHHANLFDSLSDPEGDSGDKTVRLFLDAGAPAHKLLLGAAFYGRGMNVVSGGSSELNQPSEPGSNFTRTYDEIMSLSAPEWTRHWDEAAQAPYLRQSASFLSYEDPAALQRKARYTLERGLGGVMFWEYSNNRSAELLSALHEALRSDKLSL
ncbi:MAG TPA: glycoside hydrolase family 18 protein [Polyangiaceae bacterium]|jgi:chitinase|nr:glycoside hydrolase family 18 protein [Polyangiaceae bacterium]